MYATEIKKRLTFGFSFTLALLLFLLVVALTTMSSMQNDVKTIVQQHNVKAELVSTMREVEKDRSISLYRLIAYTDADKRDLEIQRFNNNYKHD